MASREENNTEEKEEGGVFKSPKTKAGPLQPLQLSVNASPWFFPRAWREVVKNTGRKK